MPMTDKYKEASQMMDSAKRLFGDTPEYKAMQEAIARMCDMLTPLCTPDEFGVRPVFTEADYEALRVLQDDVVDACMAFINGRKLEDVRDKAEYTRFVGAQEILRFITNDRVRMRNIDFSAGQSIRDIMSEVRGRMEEVDLLGADTATGAMSLRIHLPASESRGEGYFTPARYAESLEIRLARLIDQMKQDYPKHTPFIRFLSSSERKYPYGVVQRSATDKHTHCVDRACGEWACANNTPEFRDHVRSYLDALKGPMKSETSRLQSGLPGEWSLEDMLDRQDFREMLFKLHDGADHQANQFRVLEDTGILVGRDLTLRNAAVSVLAEGLGHGDLIAKAVPMTLIDKTTGQRVPGVFMEQAKGLDLNKQNSEPLFFAPNIEWATPEAKLQLTSMQVIDWICGNTDRHTGNMFYDLREGEDGAVRLLGVQGIDNDNSFGTKSVKELIGSYGAGGADNILPTPETMGVIRYDDAMKVLSLTEKDLNLMLFNLLMPDEVSAAWDRVEALQKAILKGEDVKWKDEWETRRNIVRILSDEQVADMPHIVYAYLPSLKRLVKIPKDLETHRIRRTSIAV